MERLESMGATSTQPGTMNKFSIFFNYITLGVVSFLPLFWASFSGLLFLVVLPPSDCFLLNLLMLLATFLVFIISAVKLHDVNVRRFAYSFLIGLTAYHVAMGSLLPLLRYLTLHLRLTFCTSMPSSNKHTRLVGQHYWFFLSLLLAWGRWCTWRGCSWLSNPILIQTLVPTIALGRPSSNCPYGNGKHQLQIRLNLSSPHTHLNNMTTSKVGETIFSNNTHTRFCWTIGSSPTIHLYIPSTWHMVTPYFPSRS